MQLQQLNSNLHWGKKIEAQYNVTSGDNTLYLTLFKDSTFQERIDAKGNIYYSSGNWQYTDTVNHIFKINILKSDLDTIKTPQTRTYKIDYTGISVFVDTSVIRKTPVNFKIDKAFIIKSINKSTLIAPNSNKSKLNCTGWSLNNQQITNVINNSRFVESHIWEDEFQIIPCILDIQLEQKGVLYHLQINAGGWYSVSINDSTIYYGNYTKENNGLFLKNRKEY